MSLALAGVFGTIVATAAQAADMAFPPLEGVPLQQRPVELGTGWYLRGDGAWTRSRTPLLSSDLTVDSEPGLRNGYSFDLGFGYKFNNWFRADIVYDWRSPERANQIGPNVFCPYNLIGLSTQDTNPIKLGYYANPNDTCSSQQNASVQRDDVLLNGYADLGRWGGVTPYVGAGVGVVRTKAQSATNYYETANGNLYNVDLTPTDTFPPLWIDIMGNPLDPQPNIAFTKQNWNKTMSSTSYQFAWALMAGFALDVTDHLKFDVGYRYVNLGTFTGIALTSTGGKFVKENVSSQDVRVGFRYMVD